MAERRPEEAGGEPYRDTAFRATIRQLADGRWRVVCHVVETDTGDILRKAVDETVSTEHNARLVAHRLALFMKFEAIEWAS